MNRTFRNAFLILSLFLLSAMALATPYQWDVTDFNASTYDLPSPVRAHNGSLMPVGSVMIVIEDSLANGIAPALPNGLPSADDHVVGYIRVGDGLDNNDPTYNGMFWSTLTGYLISERQPGVPIGGRSFYVRAFNTTDTTGIQEESWVPAAGTYYCDATLAGGTLPTVPVVDNNSGGVVDQMIFPDSLTMIAGGAHTGRTSGVHLISPLGGQVLNAGSIYPIQFLAVGLTGNIDVSINRAYPSGAWTSIGTAAATDTVFNWTVTGPSAPNARIRIQSIDQPTLLDMSSSNLSILATGISLISPIGGETWVVGHADTVRWRTSGVEGTVNIELNRTYPSDAWEAIATRPPTDTIYTFTLVGATSVNARIRITSGAIGDTSNNDFTITAPGIVVVHPSEEVDTVGVPMLLTWTSQYLTGPVRIDIRRHYSTDTTWTTIIPTTPNDGVESWIPTGPLTNNARMRISSVNQPTYNGISPADFSVVAPPMILAALADTNGNAQDSLLVGTYTRIRFTAYPSLVGTLQIKLNRNYPTGTWETLASNIAVTDTAYNWLVTETASRNCRFRVVSSFDTNASVFSSANFTIYRPTITVTRPNTVSTVFIVGSTDTIRWTSTDLSAASNVRIDLNRSYPTTSAWTTIIPSTANNGSVLWPVAGANSTTSRIRIVSLAGDTLVNDISDTNFTIATPTLALTRANGGETFVIGRTDSIKWTQSNLAGNVLIELNRNYSNGSWETVATVAANSSPYFWPVTGASTTTARLRITSVVYSAIGDTSNANFSIQSPTITVTRPNTLATAFVVGTTDSILWTSTNVIGNDIIELNRNYPSGTWETVNASISDATHRLLWTVTGPATTTARIRITNLSDNTVLDVSDTNFTIGATSVAVTRPNGGETFVMTRTDTIRWNSQYVSGNVRVDLSRNGTAGPWTTLFASIANTGSTLWNVYGPATTNAYVRVLSVANLAIGDTSNAAFTIALPTFTILTHTSASDTVAKILIPDTLRWTNTNMVGNMNIQINRNYPTGVWSTVASNIGSTGTSFIRSPLAIDLSASARFRFISTVDTNAQFMTNTFRIRHAIITVTRPNGGEAFRIGTSDTIRFTIEAGVPPATNTARIYLSRNGVAGPWSQLFTGVNPTETFRAWAVTGARSQNARVLVCLPNDTLGLDTSNTSFSIVQPSITLTAPNGGSVNASNVIVRWTYQDIADTSHVLVELDSNYTDNNWRSLGTAVIAADSFVWAMPATFSAQAARFRVTVTSNTSLRDTSDANVTLAGTSVDERYVGIPTVFSMNSAYPNPFNAAISFMVGVPRNAQVKLLVYNMMGQQVAIIHNGELSQGYHRIIWNAGKLATGSYIVKMDAPGFSKVRMIQYLK